MVPDKWHEMAEDALARFVGLRKLLNFGSRKDGGSNGPTLMPGA
jgi:hypothetical protein